MNDDPSGNNNAGGSPSRQPRRSGTWLDWLPSGVGDPGPLLTRDELIGQLTANRIPATVADLRYWEYSDVLPGPVRRWHRGAVRALYPGWYVPLVAALRDLQRAGYELRTVGPILRAACNAPGAEPVPSPPWLDAIGTATPPPELLPALAELARRDAATRRTDPVPLGQVEIRLTRPDGTVVVFLFVLPPHDAPPSTNLVI